MGLGEPVRTEPRLSQELAVTDVCVGWIPDDRAQAARCHGEPPSRRSSIFASCAAEEAGRATLLKKQMCGLGEGALGSVGKFCGLPRLRLLDHICQLPFRNPFVPSRGKNGQGLSA